MADDEISMTEHLSFMDMLQPWPHHLHVFDDRTEIFGACDCGWIGNPVSTRRAAVDAYRAHIERMA